MNKSHYVYIKDFNRLMFNKSQNKNKKHFCRYCSQCFSSESILKYFVKLSKGFIPDKYLYHLKYMLLLNVF